MLILSLALFGAGVLFWGSDPGCWLLIASCIALFGRFIGESVSGLGSFVFMSVLFFAIRPIYLIIETDYELLHSLFGIAPGHDMIFRNLFWATAGLILFVIGGLAARRVVIKKAIKRRRAGGNEVPPRDLSSRATSVLLVSQGCSLLAMVGIAKMGTALYGSALGAYIYDLPAVFHGGSIVCVMVFLERRLMQPSLSRTLQLGAMVVNFALITLLMRDVSMFRSFYITGALIAVIAILGRLRSRVGYAWLVIPIVAILPLFRVMGQLRYEERTSLSRSVQERANEVLSLESYWHFFDSSGDMNIFDSFVAASEKRPAKHPYILSWAYVPFHLVPRKLWPGKPENGLLQDHSFSNGAPYSPGIAGYFVLDGGRVWMLGSMAVLGFLVSTLDMFAIQIRLPYLRCSVYAIFVVNAMLLTRVLLWQYYYQVLYMLVPCVAVAWLTRKPVDLVGLRLSSKGGQALGQSSDLPPEAR